MIAGLEEITDGTIRIGDELVNDLPPKDRDVAMIFQNYALYPHMDTYANMAFALKMRGLGKPEIDRRVRDAAKVLGLEDVLTKKPRTLSGGQRQRVAMGRAIVREPRAFLMDEPLSNLDAKLRVQMRAEIARIQRALSVTTIYVTHDQSEAMTLGDRVAVMRKGELQQLDTPQSLYRDARQPLRRRVHRLARDEPRRGQGRGRQGAIRRARASARRPQRSRRLRGPQGRARDPAGGPGRRRALRERRPTSRLPVTVDLREDMGAEIFLHFSVDAPHVATEDVKEAAETDDGVALEPQTAERNALHRARRPRVTRA